MPTTFEVRAQRMKQAKGIVLLYCIYTGAFVGTALLRRCWPARLRPS